MKKFLTFPNITIGFILLTTILGLTVGGGLNALSLIGNPEKPVAFIEQTFPRIVRTWDPKYFKEISIGTELPALQKGMDFLKNTFKQCQMGDVQKAGYSISSNGLFLTYKAQLTCDTMPAKAGIVLRLMGSSFKYVRLDIWATGGKNVE